MRFGGNNDIIMALHIYLVTVLTYVCIPVYIKTSISAHALEHAETEL